MLASRILTNSEAPMYGEHVVEYAKLCSKKAKASATWNSCPTIIAKKFDMFVHLVRKLRDHGTEIEMESVRYVKITVEIDTNKRTVKETFDSFEELEAWRESYGIDPYDEVACVINGYE